MITLYIVICSLFGYGIIRMINRTKKFKLGNFSIREKFFFSITIGSGIISVLMFILKIINISVNKVLFIPIITIAIISLLTLCTEVFKNLKKIKMKKININLYNVSGVVLFMILISIYVYYITIIVTTGDNKTINSFDGTNFYTLLKDGFSIFVSGHFTYSTNVFAVLFLILTVTSTVEIASKHNIKSYFVYLIYILLLFTYPGIDNMVLMGIKDICIMCFYSAAILYSVEYFIFEKSGENLLFSSLCIFMTMLCDPSNLSLLINLLVSVLVCYIVSKKLSRKTFLLDAVKIIMPGIICLVIWYLSSLFRLIPDKSSSNLAFYFSQLIVELDAIIRYIYKTGIWPTLVAIAILSIVFAVKNIEYSKKVYVWLIYIVAIINLFCTFILLTSHLNIGESIPQLFMLNMLKIVPIFIIAMLLPFFNSEVKDDACKEHVT